MNLGKPGERMDYLTRYLIEEEIEEYQHHQIPRREMVKRVLIITGSIPATASILLAAGCGTSPTATLAPTAARASAAASASAAPSVAASAAPSAAASAVASPTRAASPSAAASVAASPTSVASPPRAASPVGSPTTGSPTTGSPVPTRNPVTIQPTDPAIDAAAVQYSGPGGTMFGYLASPKAATKAPGIIVIHENRGLLEHIKDVTRRYAKSGFVALAIDLLSRQGGTDKVDPNQIPNLLSTADRNATIQDMVAAVAYLKTQPKFAGPKAGVVGYCFGGGMTWLLATASPDIGASVPYYGPAPDPISLIQNLAGPVLAFYGETDTRINQNIPAIEAAIAQYGKSYQKVIYPGAGHAFNNDTNPASYNEAAAKDAYPKSVDFFTANLK